MDSDPNSRVKHKLRTTEPIMAIRIPAVLFFVVLATNALQAQDFDAVERRLGEGVAKGELTLEQAGVMMEALRSGNAGKAAATNSPMKRIEIAKQKIKRLVETGDLDEKTAEMKMAALEHRMKHAAIGREIRAAVASGDLSKADAREKMEYVTKEMKFAMAEMELRHAVESGKLGESEARLKMQAIKKELFGDEEDKKDDESVETKSSTEESNDN